MIRREFIQQLGLGATALTAGLPAFGAMRPAASGHLQRGTPEAEGVASGGILDFLNAVSDEKLELHSFMLLRHGRVIAETWWAPYRAAAPHALYSLSKSFASTAIGFAVTEGKLKTSDRVVDFFPDQLPPTVDDHLAALEIRHLLSMSVGHKTDSTRAVVADPKQPDWVRAFLAVPIDYAPGSVFLYDTAATFMLSAIVQKVCGEKVVDYLQPRLFAPLQIPDKRWDSSPLGINTGGWGLSVTTEALAKFGQLYLQKGRWNGKQLLPAQWVEDAISFKIQQPATWNSGSDPAAQADYAASLKDPAAALEKLKQTSDWYQGYAYQFWRCRHNAYRGDGAFGQLCVMIPDEDAVVVITAETGKMQRELSLIWEHLLPAMRSKAIGKSQDLRSLEKVLDTRRIATPVGAVVSPTAAKVTAKRFTLQANPLGISEVTLTFESDLCVVAVTAATGHYEVQCGLGRWHDGVTDLPGEPPSILPGRGSGSVKVAAAGVWKDPQTFEMRWQFYETPHHDTVTCQFTGNDIQVDLLNSITEALGPFKALYPEMRPTLKGTASA